jgi:SAM-dependent methyltransferase
MGGDDSIALVTAYAPFAERYEAWAEAMTEDIPFYVDLAREADGPVVELAVGTGRVAVPIARETGRPVIGIDLEPAMLEQARAKSAEAGVELDLRLGDMRELDLDEPAALVICPARSLLHLPTWADRRRTFERVAAALRPGGRFAFNAFCFDFRVAAANEGHQAEAAVPHSIHHVPAESRLDITLDSGATISLWWATRNEWLGLIEVAGLEVEALYGWFDRRPFDDDAREFVFVTRRPA